MKTCPKVGEKVRLKPSHRYGALTGTVTKIYKNYDDRWDEATDEVTRGPLRPEPEWQVAMKIDGPLPANWAYIGNDTFCPEVSELVKA